MFPGNYFKAINYRVVLQYQAFINAPGEQFYSFLVVMTSHHTKDADLSFFSSSLKNHHDQD